MRLQSRYDRATARQSFNRTPSGSANHALGES